MPAIVRRSKRFKKAEEKAQKFLAPQTVDTAIDAVKSFDAPKFDQSVELIFSLGIDPKQADQTIRSSISLPHGIGKAKRVVAFCGENLIPAATAAGAIRAGGQDLVQEIEKTGFSDFDVAIATPDMMRFVGRLGKVLGPKGLMPSPKAGTVTADIATAVKEFKAGKVEYRSDKDGNLHVVVGKISFAPDKLKQNIEACVRTVRSVRPSSVKGHFIESITVSATMSPGLRVNVL